MDKVRQISQLVNLILKPVRSVHTKYVLGIDSDEGHEPFELTKRFVDMTPGAFPGYSLLSAFGRAAPLNLQYQRDNRVLPFPFHFLDNNHAMNVKPKNYSWRQFYDHVISLTKYTFSAKGSQTFTAGEGKSSKLDCKGYEKGGPNTPLEKRPAIDCKVTQVSPEKPAGEPGK